MSMFQRSILKDTAGIQQLSISESREIYGGHPAVIVFIIAIPIIAHKVRVVIGAVQKLGDLINKVVQPNILLHSPKKYEVVS